MPRSLVLVLLCLASAACVPEGAGPTSPGSDGVAEKLSLGVTKAEADVALGLDAGFERNPRNFDEACVSYAYNTATSPRYVHAVFVKDKLARRSDGHTAICTYGRLGAA